MSEPESASGPIVYPGTRSSPPDVDGPLSYYGLQAPPFRGGAEPGRLWLGKTQQALLATLTAAIGRSSGIVLLTGDIGTGKSSLAKALIDRLGDDGLLIGMVSNPGFEPSEFFEAVAGAYGIREECHTGAALVHSVQALLDRTGSSHKKVLLIIDEAQSLDDEILREVQELSAIWTTRGHPFVILLVGQTELNATLSEERHAALRQRITDACAIAPLTEGEVGEYIRHCLDGAGSEHAIFTPDAIREIASISRGAPGVINVICERALWNGSRQARTIGREIIEGHLGPFGSPDPSPGGEDRDLPRLTPIDRRDGGTVPHRSGRTFGGLTRNTRLSAILLAAVLLTTAGYFVYPAWLTSTRHNPTRETSHDTAVEKGAPRSVADGTSGVPTGVPGVARGETESRAVPPKGGAAEPATDRAARENASPPGAPGATQPPRVKDATSKSAPPRETAASAEFPTIPPPRVEERNVTRKAPDTPVPKNAPPDRRVESSDPGAIIDWLLSGSSPGTR